MKLAETSVTLEAPVVLPAHALNPSIVPSTNTTTPKRHLPSLNRTAPLRWPTLLAPTLKGKGATGSPKRGSTIEAGFTEVALVQIGATDQEQFIDWAQRELLPALRSL